jgi:hypothetical protein
MFVPVRHIFLPDTWRTTARVRHQQQMGAKETLLRDLCSLVGVGSPKKAREAQDATARVAIGRGRGRGWARRRFAPRLAGGAGARAQVAGVLSPSRVAGTDVAASPRGRGAAGPRLRDPSGGKSDRPTSSYDPSSFANVVGRDAQDLTCAPF